MTQTILRFGIPSLDYLLGPSWEQKQGDGKDHFGFSCPSNATCSFCLIGPHGSGKSILALHLAAQYLADSLITPESAARIFYISTDLSFSMAKGLWYNFALDTPDLRCIPFETAESNRQSHLEDGSLRRIILQRQTPHTGEGSDDGLAGFLAKCVQTRAEHGRAGGKENIREVAFVDLAAASAGDDWGFIHRLIAVLNQPSPGQPRHLIIVDAVEGLETLVGEKDAFGETTSRRSRIAQMLRTASNKCHVVFVAEEPAEGERIPEEFVSDVVIRLRSVHQHGFDRRTIQVEKVRGQSHMRGQHPYIIRSGRGTTTGDQPNWDDPEIKMGEAPSDGIQSAIEQHDSREYQAYVHVIHSLHLLTRNIMLEKEQERPARNPGCAQFGITHLDSMLGHDAAQKGLPRSTVTALIGDAGTHKSALGKSFLSKGPLPGGRSDSKAEVAILLTTSDIDAQGLARTFLRWEWQERNSGQSRRWEDVEKSPEFQNQIDQLLEKIICRRIEIHSQTSEVFMHLVRAAVVEAQDRIGVKPGDSPETKYKASGGIRLVIDDFSILRTMYADIREDSLFLPFLVFYLKREGVTTLIIDTHPGSPIQEGPSLFDDELRTLADHHLYTWRVLFHGESRTAIAAIPPICSKGRSRIRELRSDRGQDCRPEVHRGLELYSGLEHGSPQQVPLQVRLYAETGLLADYLTEMNTLLGEFYRPVSTDGTERSNLVVAVSPQGYGTLHDFCNLQAEHSLDHTLILQVDEFWALGPPGPWDIHKASLEPPLRLEEEYLKADLDDIQNEPLQLFGPHGCRLEHFSLPGCSLKANEIDRIPMMWDFGFLLCNERAWDMVQKEKVRIGSEITSVGAIWNDLPSTSGQLENTIDFTAAGKSERASWREFLGACQTVSRTLGYGEEYVPFELSMVSGESFSCLLLEIWASEILDRLLSETNKSKAAAFVDSVSHKRWTAAPPPENGLIEWLKEDTYVIDFYMAWLLLVDALPLKQLLKTGHPLDFVERLGSTKAIASRQWYKTACQQVRQRKDQEPMFVAGLPGHFSMRGDWFLGVARGSKSDLLADRVLDLLTTRRNNFTRLYQGIGLPARILGGEQEDLAFLTNLSWKDKRGEPRTVHYGELLAIGPTPVAGSASPSGFYWLWRSALRDYHQHSRVLQRWNGHTVLMWNAFKAEAGENWKSGFEIYDQLSGQRPRTTAEMDAKMKTLIGDQDQRPNTWEIFRERCNLLGRLLTPFAPTHDEAEQKTEAAA
ncbi:MAG: RAD55 family ATPase [Candidatus Angelobacter sp.]